MKHLPQQKNKQHTGDKWVIPFWLAVQGLCFRFFTAMLRAPEISVEVCLLSGRSCLVAISPSDNLMLLLQRSREKLDVDISTLIPWNLGDETTTFVSSRKSWWKMESVWFICYEEWIRRWIDEEIIENKPVYIYIYNYIHAFGMLPGVLKGGLAKLIMLHLQPWIPSLKTELPPFVSLPPKPPIVSLPSLACHYQAVSMQVLRLYPWDIAWLIWASRMEQCWLAQWSMSKWSPA